MPSDDSKPPNTSRPQSIPLQDLSRPPDIRIGDGEEEEEWGRGRRESGGRARALLGSRQGFSGRIKTGGRYERVLAASSSETTDNEHRDIPHITTPRTAHRASFYDDGELSPVNIGDFQAAMGSVGLSLDTPGPAYYEPSPAPSRSTLNPIMEDTAVSPFSTSSVQNDSEDYFAGHPNDTSPLTDSRFLQPISGSPLPPASGQSSARHSATHSYGMLGDDLPGLEGGFRGSGRRSMNRMSSLSVPSLSRSLSSSASPLTSAGSMLRKMSQRVVNLSHEPEMVESSTRRQATMDEPPSFPALTGYAHDDLSHTPPPLEKAPPLAAVGKPQHKWQQQVNPLRGKTLGIFSPHNHIRLWLCEILVHPITEPLILILIIIQTIALTVQAAPSMEYGGRPQGWGGGVIDYLLLALFILYTLEIAAKIIVSGFVNNAAEYSARTSNMPVWKSVLEGLRNLLPRTGGLSTKKTLLPMQQTFRFPF